MNTGYLCRLNGSYAEEDLHTEGQTKTDGGYEWIVKPESSKQATLREGGSNESIVSCHTGTAAWTVVEENETTHITDGGEITSRPERLATVESGSWLLIPAGGVAVVSDMKIVGKLNSMLRGTGAEVEPSNINVRAWMNVLDESRQWGTGFSGRLPANDDGEGIFKGQVYGDAVERDPDLGGDLERTPLNQAGVDLWWRSQRVKCYAAESGYFAAWADTMETRQFAAFVVEQLSEHLEVV